MTHTFLKDRDGYHLGQWVRSFHHPGTDTFCRLGVRVNTLRSAIRLVNVLNGGTGRIDEPMARFEIIEDDNDRADAAGLRVDMSGH